MKIAFFSISLCIFIVKTHTDRRTAVHFKTYLYMNLLLCFCMFNHLLKMHFTCGTTCTTTLSNGSKLSSEPHITDMQRRFNAGEGFKYRLTATLFDSCRPLVDSK